MVRLFALFFGLATILLADASYYENGKLVELNKAKTLRSASANALDVYETEHGKRVGITDEILVKCKEDVDCKSLLEQFGLYDATSLTKQIMIVKVQDYDQIFDLSRRLFESGKVDFAHPNFTKERKLR